MTNRPKRNPPRAKPVGGFRSKFEKDVSRFLKRNKVKYDYEKTKLEYQIEGKYTVDFDLPNGILIETKGVLSVADRRKMRAVKKAHPELDIRFVFQNAFNKLDKRSKTTYAQWAEKNGFKWAHKQVPKEWLDENTNT